jgi:EamA domain-containing membrane protein RarD
MLRSWTRGLLPMHSSSTALTLTAYLLTRTAMRLPMITNCLTDTLTDAVPCLLILSGLSQHSYCMLSDPYLLC